MEKQPVDDLFARKLREAEAPVGPDVFGQLQQRMGTKQLPTRRRPVAWWYVASAACLLVAFWFMYVANKNQPPVNVPVAHMQTVKQYEATLAKATESAGASPIRQQQIERFPGKQAYRRLATASETYPGQKSIGLKSQLSIHKQAPVSPKHVPEQIAVSQASQQVPATSVATVNPTIADPIERLSNQQRSMSERTITLTIAEPQPRVTDLPMIENPLAGQTQQNRGLSGLFGKLKQLKNGEVLAKATPASSQSNSGNRFGRVFTEVKESLKNETTLE